MKELPSLAMTSLLLAASASVGSVPAQAQVLAGAAGGPGAARPVYYQPAPVKAEEVQADVCIYGGNSAGVAAALQLARVGRKPVIVEPSRNLGGLSAGGLGETDIGNKAAIGGISREFYRRVGQKYGVAEEWKFEPRVADAVFRDMVAEAKAPVYLGHFLKSVTKDGARITSLTTESGLTVRARLFIDASYEGDLMAKSGVAYHVGREDNAVYGEQINGVQVHKLHQFDLPVDPYVVEGDPKSGLLPGINPGPIPPTGSGDSKLQAYNFRLCLTNDPANRIPFEKPAAYDPREYVLLARYLKAGWPEAEAFRKFDPIQNSFKQAPDAPTNAGLLAVSDLTDARGLIVKLRNGRGPLTKYLKGQLSPALRAQLDATTNAQAPSRALVGRVVDELNGILRGGNLYTPERFAMVNLPEAARAKATQALEGEERLRSNRALLQAAYAGEIGARKYLKVDKNNHGAVSTDFIGRNYAYPEASYAEREKIFQEHVTYQKGLMWFMGNDPAVPEKIRTRWSTWGLPRDEFQATGGWPHQLYVREARRMISDYVMTEADCRGQRAASDPVSLAAYTMDSHNVQRFVKDGRVWNEGDVQQKGFPPYPISYRSIVPRKSECENLFVPVCLAASHIAYGSIRMEPVFMILGQSSALAAHLALENNRAVQDVPYAELLPLLQKGSQILAWPAPQNAAATQNANAAVASTLGAPAASRAPLDAFLARLEAGQKQTVVLYGTSLTRGGAWPAALKKWFDQKFPGQVKLVNSGLSGQNSDAALAQVKAQVLDKNPDLVFIEFGINDAHAKFAMPVERGASNLGQVVAAIRQQNPQAAIVLQVMSLPWDAPNGNRSASDRPQLAAFYDNYRAFARQNALPLIDHAPDWQKLRDAQPAKFQAYLPDGVHPSKEGDLAVNWPPIQALLERR